ncbi:MAG: tetratricopeptide repeat protein, partial [Bdellovibrionales bacterium]|nr:tetratricopeptide repeat protein [Bdellovibrionales bacterium]
ERGNFPKAEKTLTRLLKAYPDDPFVSAAHADLALEKGDLAGGERWLKKALLDSRSSESMVASLSQLYVRTNQWSKAESLLASVLADEPDSHPLRIMYGKALYELGSLEQAHTEFLRAVRSHPANIIAVNGLIETALRLGKCDEIRKLDATIPGAVNEAPVHNFVLGRVAELDHHWSKAKEEYLKAVPVLPDFAPVFQRLGTVSARLGEIDTAMQYFERCVAVEPSDVVCRLNLARDHLKNMRLDAAKEQLRFAIKHQPNNVQAATMLADVMLLEGDASEALGLYQLVAPSLPDKRGTALREAMALEQLQQPHQAISLYRTALTYPPSREVAAERLQALLLRTDTEDGALQELRALHRKEQLPETARALAEALHKTGSKKNAKEVDRLLQWSNETSPDNLRTLRLQGSILADRGDLKAATDRYSKVVALDPTDARSWRTMGILYERLAQPSAAAHCYERALEQVPDDYIAANNLAWILVDNERASAGELHRAVQLAKRAAKLQPESPVVNDTLAWAYYRADRPRVAQQTIEDAIRFAEAQKPRDEALIASISKHRDAIAQAAASQFKMLG